MSKEQLECRIVLTFRRDRKTEVGMYDPKGQRYTDRYVSLGVHGPSVKEVDKVVRGLMERIQKEGHLLTFCERSE